ncbi:hypothetical protein [Tsukamurella spumae]|nr:hypothetical protein [Tsukamurella spumae]
MNPLMIDPADREAWKLREVDRLTWPAIAAALDETEAHVQRRVERYIAATDAAAAAAQPPLFTL